MALMPPAPSHFTMVAPGARHKLKATAPGYLEWRDELTVAGGEHKLVRAALEEGGQLAVRTNVAAHLLVDGKPLGVTPMAPVTLPPGAHAVTLRSTVGAGERDYQTTVTV